MLQKYKYCPACNKELPYTRVYFKRYGSPQNGVNYHLVCRECENKIALMSEWKDGKLLCHYCGEYKNENEFGNNGKNGSKFRNYKKKSCRKCATQRQKYHNLSLDGNEKLLKCMRFRYLGAKDRARKNNYDFNISFEYIMELWNKQNGICALSGMKMTYELQKGRIPTNVSIDKIDRTKGYTIGNVQLVCMAVNQMKSDLTDEQLYMFCKNILKNRHK